MKQPKIIQKIPREKKIMLMESNSNYTIIHLSDGKKLLSGYNLKFYEDRTDNQSFMRLNRSEMINKTFVKLINLDEFSLTLNNGRRVHISRRRMKAFQAWI
ncbi:MAG: LytR/AlgR family response regulator transcription factor [Emticicia sp.]|uniref:LytR/AlgR family response regulator transcription factor n=1 Tax=Emticicia sp. TaxID=1930953 RepID=UPI003BA79F5E